MISLRQGDHQGAQKAIWLNLMDRVGRIGELALFPPKEAMSDSDPVLHALWQTRALSAHTVTVSVNIERGIASLWRLLAPMLPRSRMNAATHQSGQPFDAPLSFA